MTATGLTPERWALARRRRAEGATLAVIAAELGAPLQAVRYRCRKERWPSPSATPRGTAGTAASAPENPPPPQARLGRSRVRLARCPADLYPGTFRVIDLERRLLELKMAQEELAARKGARVGPQEENSRGVGAHLKHVQQSKEFQSDPHRAAEGGGKPSADAEARALADDAFRLKIAERVEAAAQLPGADAEADPRS